MKDEATPIDEVTMTDMLKNIFEHEEKMQKYMETQAVEIKEKHTMIERLFTESKKQKEEFATKLANMKVTAPVPDLSEAKEAITAGLAGINKSMATDFVAIREAINRGPAPITRNLQLFSDAKTPEQYKAVLSWIVFGLIGLVTSVGTIMLIWHYMNLTHVR
ncbi:hypothetical protein [Mucilaginibacter sp. 22184]|uniref:hypothetical protein n=1 Tax=Mucilaginibacter sp. 22184 TaxID=3453887 RepID=UPI003F852E4D